jgi:hypothetical protein
MAEHRLAEKVTDVYFRTYFFLFVGARSAAIIQSGSLHQNGKVK